MKKQGFLFTTYIVLVNKPSSPQAHMRRLLGPIEMNTNTVHLRIPYLFETKIFLQKVL